MARSLRIILYIVRCLYGFLARYLSRQADRSVLHSILMYSSISLRVTTRNFIVAIRSSSSASTRDRLNESRVSHALRNIAVGHSDFKYLPRIIVCVSVYGMYVHTHVKLRTFSSSRVHTLSRVLARRRKFIAQGKTGRSFTAQSRKSRDPTVRIERMHS